MIRPSHRLAPSEHPEWLQMEVAAREAEDRRARRLELARLALWLTGAAAAVRAGMALAS